MAAEAQTIPGDYPRVLLIEHDDGNERQLGTFWPCLARGVTEPFPSGDVGVDQALEWGRAVADIVVLQIGGQQFSAGRLAEPNRPIWVDGTELRVGRYWYEPPGPAISHYWVRITGDGSPLDPELAQRFRGSRHIREVRTPAVSTLDVAVAQGDENVDDVASDLLNVINEELCPFEAELEMKRVNGRWVHPTYEFWQDSWTIQTVGPAA